jgi:hypothetical protein
MSVALDGEVIRVTGDGRIEDAETLTGLLHAHPGRSIDLAEAGTLHTAVVQVLLAFRPRLEGRTGDDFINTWLLPELQQPTVNPQPG